MEDFMEKTRERIEELNHYAKTLGMTLYRIDYGFIKNGQEYIHIMHGVNKYSEQYRNFWN